MVDMHGEASVRLRTMDEFLDGRAHPELAVMRYAGDTAAAKDISAALAIAAQQQQLSDCKFNLSA